MTSGAPISLATLHVSGGIHGTLLLPLGKRNFLFRVPWQGPRQIVRMFFVLETRKPEPEYFSHCAPCFAQTNLVGIPIQPLRDRTDSMDRSHRHVPRRSPAKHRDCASKRCQAVPGVYGFSWFEFDFLVDLNFVSVIAGRGNPWPVPFLTRHDSIPKAHHMKLKDSPLIIGSMPRRNRATSLSRPGTGSS